MSYRNFSTALVLSVLLAGCVSHPGALTSAPASRDGNGLGEQTAALVPLRIKSVSTSSTPLDVSVGASSAAGSEWLAIAHLMDGNLRSAWGPAADDIAPSILLEQLQPGCLQGLSIKMEGATLDVAVWHDGAWTVIAAGVRPRTGVLDFVGLPGVPASRVKLTFHRDPGTALRICEVTLFGCPTGASPAPSASPGAGASPTPTPTPSPSASASAPASAQPCLAPVPLTPLLNNFAVLAGSTVTNTGPTVLSGDLGLYPGTAIEGFLPGVVAPPHTRHQTDDVAKQAQADLTVAYNDAKGRIGAAGLAGSLGGQTLGPGVYNVASSLTISSAGLTLSGNGDPNAVFIFQIGSALTLDSGARITRTNGAEARHIVWQVGSSATLGTGSVVEGSILANTSITLTTGARLNGRALARTGAVTLDTNTVDKTALPQFGCL